MAEGMFLRSMGVNNMIYGDGEKRFDIWFETSYPNLETATMTWNLKTDSIKVLADGKLYEAMARRKSLVEHDSPYTAIHIEVRHAGIWVVDSDGERLFKFGTDIARETFTDYTRLMLK